MKKTWVRWLLCLLLGWGGVFSGRAQLWSESFESGVFPPEGWVVRNNIGAVDVRNGYFLDSVGHTGGMPRACSDGTSHYLLLQSGYCTFPSRNKLSTSWLQTPAFDVTETAVLRFSMGLIARASSAAIADTLDVLISENGEEQADFSQRLVRIFPGDVFPVERTDTAWMDFAVDLSAYNGKNVRIAFVSSLTTPNLTSWWKLALDNLRIENQGESELSLISMQIEPYASCDPERSLSFNVYNAGLSYNSTLNVSYQVNGGEIYGTPISVDVASQQSVAFKLPQNIQLEDGENRIKVWLTTTEGEKKNDTLATVVTKTKSANFPYVKGQQSDGEYFEAEKITQVKDRWKYTKLSEISNDSVWLGFGTSSKTLMGPCMNLPTGNIRVSFDVRVTADVRFSFYTSSTGDNKSEFLSRGETVGFTSSFIHYEQTLEIKKAGWQSLSWSAAPMAGAVQVLIKNITIEVQPENLRLERMMSPVFEKQVVSETPMEVSVQIKNQGSLTRRGFSVCYQYGSNAIVKETSTEALAPGSSEAFTFSEKLDCSRESQGLLKVWVEDVNEIERVDDTLSMPFKVYRSVTPPYCMGFESGEDFSVWTVYNPDKSPVVYWDTAKVFFTLPGKGQSVCFLPAFSGTTANDVLISPALRLEKGRYRLSFYHAAILYGGSNMNLSVFVGRTPDPAGLLKEERLSFKMANDFWLSAYLDLPIEEAGLYYIALKGTGVSTDVFIDDFRVDQAQDLCVLSTAFSEQTGYDKTNTEVEVVFKNHGTANITQVQAEYWVNGVYFSEPISLNLAPGNTYKHVFSKKADISVSGEYALSVRVSMENDADTLNNRIAGASIQHWPHRQLPYLEDFSVLENRLKWETMIIDSNSDWNTWSAAGNVNNNAYSGTEALAYSSGMNRTAKEWAFSEPVDVEAETLRLSFFYRTFRNFPDRKEDFKVGIFSAAHPDSLLFWVQDFRQVSVSGINHAKHISYFTPAQPQTIYIGFYAYTAKGQNGMIYIDDILLEKPQAKAPLYASDFDQRGEEWYIYYPGLYRNCWEFTQVEEIQPYSAKVELSWAEKNIGFLVSPAFQLQEGKGVEVEVDYQMIRKGDVSIGDTLEICMGYENHPDSLNVKLATLRRADTLVYTWRDTITMEHNRKVYFGIIPKFGDKKDDKPYMLVKNFSLKPEGMVTYSVQGRVLDPEMNPLAGASVGFTGTQTMSQRTDEDGRFEFTELFGGQKFRIMIYSSDYQLARLNGEITDADVDLGDLFMKEIPQRPAIISAVDKEDSAIVSWIRQEELVEFRRDNGVVSNSLGLPQGTLNTPLAVAYQRSATVAEVSWYLEKPGKPIEYVTVYVFALDADGRPTTEVLYRKDRVPNTTKSWNAHILDYPVECPNGFMVGIACDGFAGLACDNGTSEEYPFVEGTQFIVNLLTGQITSFEEQNIRCNLFIRARGLLDKEAKRMEGYQLARFRTEHASDTTHWVILNTDPIDKAIYVDRQWKDLPQGFYQYAVRSVYSLNVKSAWQKSNELACKLTMPLTVTVSSDLNATEAKATVRLAGEAQGSYYEEQTDSKGIAVFERILRGKYTVSVLKNGFEPISEDKILEEVEPLAFKMEEALTAPQHLMVSNTFEWNGFANMKEGFEVRDGHAAFAINSAGNWNWTFLDGDDTYTLGYSGLEWEGKGSKMAYQVFNPKKTTPVMQGDFYAPHGGSQYITTFPSYREKDGKLDTVANDDWIISPELEYHSDFDFAFFARSVANHNGLERMNVYYSESGNQRSDFIKITAGEYTDVPDTWTQYSFHLPAKTRYVAIQCVSRLNLQFMVDDISFMAQGRNLAKEYVVYVDGKEKLRTTKTLCPLSTLNIAPGKHTLGVQAVYQTGLSEISQIDYDATPNERLQKEPGLILYPNPVTDKLYVKTGERIKGYELYSGAGTRLLQGVPTEDFSVDMGGLSSGVYTLVVSYKNGIRCVRKVVKR